jgi:peptide/nickel transport system permease protein
LETRIWQQLWRRTSVKVALWFIAFCVLIAVFAYPLSPDSSPNANRMIVELKVRPPGYGKYFLRFPRTDTVQERSFWSALFTGQEPREQLIPINYLLFRKDSFAIVHYIGVRKQDTLHYALKAVLPYDALNLPLNEQREMIGKQFIEKRHFWLGTDRYGRDNLSRLLLGTRVSLGVGLVAAILPLSIGLFIGVFSGYFRGRTDKIVMYLINVLWAIPVLLLLFEITSLAGIGYLQIFIAIGLTIGVSTTFLIRGRVSTLREMEYIKAAQTLGLSDFRIIFHHILPNIAGLLMVIAVSNFASAILIEAGLSFLGIGVQPPMSSWGLMIREQYFLMIYRPSQVLIPGVAIFFLVYAFNILGNALREVVEARGK